MGDAGTVLVVDDDDSIRLLCRVNLELDGYRVLEAATLDAALAQLAQEEVDVTLLDLHVGAHRNEELVDAVRAARPAAPIVLLTGSAEVPRSVREGVDGMITKPFTIDELAQTVGRVAGAV